MPSLNKQRRANIPKALAIRLQPIKNHQKNKPINPLSRKIKRNNNLLAKALSLQKQENQLLFAQNIELTSQLQALGLACNRRDIILGNVQNNAKEILSLLVTMTNYVTDTIVSCQEFVAKTNISPQLNNVSVTRRDSRRLSVKSPARGVVKPMVSGHTITKPTISLRRVNMPRINTMLNLSSIEETSSEQVNNVSINHRIGYEGGRRRRLPERIPLDFMAVDDDEDTRLSRRNSRLSGRSSDRPSGRLSSRPSSSRARPQSGNLVTEHAASPRVALSDVSKLLQNAQTINLRMLRDSTNRDSGRSPDLERTMPASRESSTRSNSSRETKIPSKKSSYSSIWKVPFTNTSLNRSDNTLDVDDPIEGPSWLLDRQPEISQQPEMSSSSEDDDDDEAKILQKSKNLSATVVNHLDVDSITQETDADVSMELSQCVTSNHVHHIYAPRSNNKSTFNEDPSNGSPEISFAGPNGENTSQNLENLTDRCEKLSINHKTSFITNRRRQTDVDDDDDDDDTMMLQFRQPPPRLKFNINELKLPVLDAPVVPADQADSEPEVTTTIRRIPQNFVETLSVNDNMEVRPSINCDLQLPAIDETLTSTTAHTFAKRKAKRNRDVRLNICDSDSESSGTPTPKKLKKKGKNAKFTKDLSCAKVVLEKLDNIDLKCGDSFDSIQSETHTTEQHDDSHLSTNSNNSYVDRPRRRNKPNSLKEPSLRVYSNINIGNWCS